MPNDSNLTPPESIGETIHEIYRDGLQPAVKTTGKILDLVPRLVYAALSPLELFLCKTESTIEQARNAISEKLSTCSPEEIVAPEPYVAVPALQYLVYSIDNDELRNLYANLLAKSMYQPTKRSVHPSFIEIIKQLSPTDANLFKIICDAEQRPLLSLSALEKSCTKSLRLELFHKISASSYNITSWKQIPYLDQAVSLSNLERLGLIDCSSYNSYVDDKIYDSVRCTEFYCSIKNELQNEFPNLSIEETKKVIKMKPMGTLFYEVCVSDSFIFDE